MDQLMTINDLADYLKVPTATIYYWRHEGVGPPTLKVRRALRYRRRDVDTWLEQQSGNEPFATSPDVDAAAGTR